MSVDTRTEEETDVAPGNPLEDFLHTDVNTPPPGRSGGAGGSGHRSRPLKLRLPAPAPKDLGPRTGRWWAGVAILAVSVLLLSFVAHVAVFSSFQHHRSQTGAYETLRDDMARGITPVGQLDAQDEMTVPGTPVALMEIPALDQVQVVVEGTGSEELRSGPGHRRDSVMPGQAGTSVLMGRQTTYGGPFGSLNRLAPGDEITITTGQGVNTYRVFGLRTAGDPVPEPLRAGRGRLELQTANGLSLFPNGVLHVDAELVSDVQPTPSRVMAEAALPPGERAMGQDSSVLFSAFFVFVFFLAAVAAAWWLWKRWGRWHAWIVGVPVLLTLGVTMFDLTMNALPNLL